MVAVLVACALGAPLLAPHDPLAPELVRRLEPPSADHPLGTDEIGRDLLSRLIFGARLSLAIAVGAAGLALLIGAPVGLVAGYYGGILDGVAMRIVEVALAFPAVLLAILVVAMIGPGITNVALAIAVVMFPQYTRVARGGAMEAKVQNHIEAMRALGASDWRILLRGIFPGTVGPLVAQTTLGLGTAILDVAGLSFLGLGAPPPTPEWGAMIAGGREVALQAPWILLFPGIAILLTVLSFNLLGEAIRTRYTPRTLVGEGGR
jgi:peptide/nickel transport system permease protein